MKKVLLTSTALVLASASFAAAEIALSGSAEMGVRGATLDIETSDDTLDDFSSDLPLQFHTDIDVTFSMSGETDGGLAFGASVDLDEGGDGSDSGDNDFDDGGATIFISGDFGTVTLGDTDGALDRVLTEAGNIANPGSLNDAETDHIGYNGDYLDGSGDGQIMRYDYAFDAFQFALSVEQMPTGSGGVVTEDDDDLTWAIGFGYEFEFASGSVDLGLGYQYSDDGSIPINIGSEDQIGVDVNGDGDTDDDIGLLQFAGIDGDNVGEVAATGVGAVLNLDNGLSAGIEYTHYALDDADDDLNHLGLGVGYSFDAFSVHFNYGQYQIDDANVTGYGLSAGYDLGGGASLLFGYGNSSTSDLDFDGDGDSDDFTASSYSFGLSFSF